MKKILQICLFSALMLPQVSNAKLPKFLLNKIEIAKENKLQAESNLKKLYAEYKDTKVRNYDVISYSLDLDWYDVLKNSNLGWTGINTIILESKVANLTEIELDAGYMEILSVKAFGEELQFNQDSVKNLLVVKLNESLNISDEIAFEIKYRHIVKPDNLGFNYYYQSDTSGVLENLAYTMAEPKDARYWMPCNDISSDRALSDFKIKVPLGYTAVANGSRLDSSSVADTSYFHWSHNFPMPTYLLAVTASKFETYSDKYIKKDNSVLSIDYYYWKWYSKYSNNGTTLPAFDLHNNMMAYFSQILFEYPYEKYGVVSITPFGGGMEHNTITTIGNTWIVWEEDNGLAHELAHHWLGNYITCADWQDLWINEGGATWAASIWTGHYYGKEALKTEIRRHKYLYFQGGGADLPPVYNLDDENLFSEALTYRKAGMVYHMLSAAIGEEQFLKTLQKIFTTYPLTSITTQQFRDIVKQENPDYPLSWDTFFDQWLLQRGHPELTLNFAQAVKVNENFKVEFKINQTQLGSEIPGVFEMPVFIEYTKPTGDTLTKKYYMNQREQSFADTLDFQPIHYSINEYMFLGAVNSIAKVEEQESGNIAIYPSIAQAGDEIKCSINKTEILSDVRYEIYNELGEVMSEGTVVVANPLQNGTFSFKLPNLSVGLYVVRIHCNNTVESQKIIVK